MTASLSSQCAMLRAVETAPAAITGDPLAYWGLATGLHKAPAAAAVSVLQPLLPTIRLPREYRQEVAKLTACWAYMAADGAKLDIQRGAMVRDLRGLYTPRHTVIDPMASAPVNFSRLAGGSPNALELNVRLASLARMLDQAKLAAR